MGDSHQSYGREAYLQLIAERPELFQNRPGDAIEILTNPADMDHAEREVRQRWANMGYGGDDFRCGVLSSDPFMTLVRDAVRFPDGSFGLHNRLLEGRSVAVIPVWQGKFLLIRIYRHGLREWSWEFPRGGANPDETSEQAIRRELREEIGAEISTLTDLGSFTPGGSVLAVRAQLYMAELSCVGTPSSDEAISQIRGVDQYELSQMIGSGQIIDGFTISIVGRALANDRLTGYGDYSMSEG